MWLNLLLLWSGIVICGGENFSIVSTSKATTDYQKSTNILSKLEENYRLVQNLVLTNSQEFNRRLEQLEGEVSKLTLAANKKSVARETFPNNCLEVKRRGYNYGGTFFVHPKFALRPFSAVCEMTKREGGWTLILKRSNNDLNFDVDWINYQYGFGHLGGDFWLGLEYIYQLSSYEINELLVEMVDSGSKHSHAHYKYFSIGSEDEGYPLKIIGGFSGDAGDSLAYHAGSKFTTKDRDQDNHSSNCADLYTGGWWYNGCHWSHLTGKYSGVSNKYKSVCWGEKFYLKEARMYIKPQSERILFP